MFENQYLSVYDPNTQLSNRIIKLFIYLVSEMLIEKVTMLFQ